MFDHDRAEDVPVGPETPEPTEPDDPGWADSESGRLPSAAPRTRRPGPRPMPQPAARLRTALRQRPVVLVVAVVATALVAGLFAWTGGRQGGIATASRPLSSKVADAAAMPSGSAGPGASNGVEAQTAYVRLTGASTAPGVRLTARGASGLVVPLGAIFRLETIDAGSASKLAAGLTVEPAITFTTKQETGDRAVVISPTRPLAAGTVYRFALRGATGELVDTWAFQAAQPLRIVGTLPETQSSGVPLDTGIEVTFDQDGVVDAASHVAIRPATTGRFEEHGRTLAFIPDRPLAPITLYTVTVSRGIAVGATGEKTVADTRFQFETAPVQPESENLRSFVFPNELAEASTAERPTIGVWSFGGDAKPPASMQFGVYRLGGLDAAIAAFRTIRARPDWTLYSAAGLVDVSGLTRVVAATLPLNAYRNGFWVELPEPLAAGWYLVQQSEGNKPIQLVLQVTDIAGYLAVSDTKTIVWANDLRTTAPVVGASVASEGVTFGRTDSDGLAVSATPPSLTPAAGASCTRPCDPVVVVRANDGRRIFLPVAAGHDKLEGDGDLYWWSDADARTWSLLHTDRTRYRSGDTVNLWGVARDRASGAVPAAVVIRLDGQSDDPPGAGGPPIATLTRHPDTAGAFSASLPLAGLPDGYFVITVSIDGRTIRTTAIQVGPLPKPAYELDVTTGRQVYIAGDHVTVTVGARFFEGTPVPGVPLRMSAFTGDDTTEAATTDALGRAVWRTIAALEGDAAEAEGPTFATVSALPARAEEAEITAGSRNVIVFPSSRTIDAIGRITDDRVVVSGGVHLVAVNRLEAAIAAGSSLWDLDPRGAAVRNASVTIRFIELVPKRTRIGTEYDFVEKKVVPVYQTEITERPVGTVDATTSANGSWSASVAASAADHGYRIVATVRDPDGHIARITSYASRNVGGQDAPYPLASLAPTSATANPDHQFGVGERIDLKLIDPDRRQATGDGTRYLFFAAQRGIRTAMVQASRRFVTIFPAWGPPNVSIGGVRFTGAGYVGTAWFAADFRVTERRLRVEVSTDAARYAPGGTVHVDVATRSPSGAPVRATVVLRAVDEKLFSIGAAADEDPLGELYAGVGSGMIGTYRSHRDPQAQFEGGDTGGGGGGDRDDFRDSLLFRTITTGADGRGSVTFRLSDDLTSWRVTAAAVTERLQAGVGSAVVPVGLPFFVDASIAPEYLLADRPAIAVRTFGSAVAAGTPVMIRVVSPGLDFDSGPLASTASANLDITLPALRTGPQTVTITATTGSGATARTDRLTRTFAVLDTRLTRARTAYVELPSTVPFRGGSDFTSVVISDASGGRYLALLTDLASGGGARLDRALAADLATTLLKDDFGVESLDRSAEPFSPDRYQGLDDGLGVVPYASSDLELSSLVAIVAPERVNRTQLAFYLWTIHDDGSETRERRMYALAGLAGLGEPVLRAIRAAAADPDLTVREQLMVGLGAASLGDSATARSVLGTIAAAVGEESGTLARLRVGTSAADITAGTALAAAVGDPLGPRFQAYVEANPAPDRIEVLPAIAFVARTLERLPVRSAKVAWTVDGTRHAANLDVGGSIHLRLTSAQLASLSVERVAGTIGVTTRWREPVVPTAFRADPDLTITRSVQPASPVRAADLVVVELHVSFAAQAATGCRQVTELVPSGLAPVGASSRWADPDVEEVVDTDVVLPYDQSGSQVFFCVGPDPKHREFILRYVARVVTPGRYAWEPAVAQSGTDEGIANVVPPSTITIR